jgi:DNA repair exonuclease SbcCD nuclease subunit
LYGGTLAEQNIVLSSDWHLKFTSQFDSLTEKGIPSRLDEIITSVKWVIEQGKKHKAATFIGCGDIFDAPEKLPTREGLAISEMFKQIKGAYSNSFFIAGNHDQISSDRTILDLFSPLVKVFNNASFVDVADARLFFLPYTREAEDLYAAIKSFEKFDCPGKKYLFAHFWDKTIMSVDPEAIDLNRINLDFFDRIFLGHFHVPTEDMDSKVIYLGTLLNKRFNETGKKGCWILNTKKNSIKFVENPNSPTFVVTKDTNLLGNIENIITNAYYRVECSPDNVLAITKLLSACKGVEIVSKSTEAEQTNSISLASVEKKNASSLKDYILANCNLFMPDGVTEQEFKTHGQQFLGAM